MVFTCLTALALMAGCGGDGLPDSAGEGARGDTAAEAGSGDPRSPDGAVEPRADGEGSGDVPGGAAGPVDILFVGTSLTEGWGLDDPDSQAWPARVLERAREEGLRPVIRNAGLSGETSAGAVRRIDWVLPDPPPGLVVVETGANDGLRALPVEELEANLVAVVRAIRERAPDACIALVTMEAPPNLGDTYTEAFRNAYRDVARSEGVELLPFLLEGVAGEPELNLEDGIHPTAEGHRKMADFMWPALAPLVERCTHDGSRERAGNLEIAPDRLQSVAPGP